MVAVALLSPLWNMKRIETALGTAVSKTLAHFTTRFPQLYWLVGSFRIIHTTASPESHLGHIVVRWESTGSHKWRWMDKKPLGERWQDDIVGIWQSVKDLGKQKESRVGCLQHVGEISAPPVQSELLQFNMYDFFCTPHSAP